VIEACFAQLEALVGTAAACRGSGRSRATHYRRLAPPLLGPPVPRGAPANALSEAETAELLGVLRSPRFCDLAPAQVWAILLDEGCCPPRSMRMAATLTVRRGDWRTTND